MGVKGGTDQGVGIYPLGMRLPALTLALPLLLMGACSVDTAAYDEIEEGGTSEATPCLDAFEDAAEVPDTQDTLADLWPAVDACETLEDFTAASEEHPDALDGADPETYVRNQCEYEPEVADSALCQSL